MRRCDRKKKCARLASRAAPALCDRCRQKRRDGRKACASCRAKTTCAANAHLDLPSKNQSHRLCRPLCRKLCRKHQNAPFSQKLRLIFKKNRDKTSPYLSCHDRSHQYPVTEQKILAKNQHLLTSFAAIRYPFDTLPVCPQPPAMEAAASRPGHSWARPAPPSPRAAAPPARRSSPSSTTVSRAEMLHCAAWPQVKFSAPGPLDSPAPGWPRRIIPNTLTVKLTGVHPRFGGDRSGRSRISVQLPRGCRKLTPILGCTRALGVQPGLL